MNPLLVFTSATRTLLHMYLGKDRALCGVRFEANGKLRDLFDADLDCLPVCRTCSRIKVRELLSRIRGGSR